MKILETMVIAMGTLALAACGSDARTRPSAPAPAPTAPSGQVWTTVLPGDGAPAALAVVRDAVGGDAWMLIAVPDQGALYRVDRAGAVGAEPWLAGLDGPRAVDAEAGHVWVAEATTLRRIDRVTRAVAESVALPAEASISDVAVGFDGTVFASDAGANRIYAVAGGNVRVFVEGAELSGPGPLQLNGGQLLVGSTDGLHSIHLGTGARTPVATGIGDVIGLALDHLGYFVVRTAGTDTLLRVTPDGVTTTLDIRASEGGAIGFDDVARSVIAVDAARRSVVAYSLPVLANEVDLWAERDARPMRPFEHHGIILAGAEYWPNVGDVEVSYPDDILWGFYPEPGVVFEGEAARAAPTPAALACAHEAYDRLRAWVATNPARFHEAASRGRSNRFYLWTNDYSQASDPVPYEMRPAKFWYWQRKPAVPGRVPGYWKWESSVTQDGACHTPDPAQIDAYLDGVLAQPGSSGER